MKNTIPKSSSLTQKALSFWGGILIVWSLYRSYFRLPIEIDELIVKPLVFVLPIIYFIQKIEKKNPFKSLWLDLKKLPTDLLISLGFFLILLLIYAFLATNNLLSFEIKNLHNLGKILLINFSTAFTEDTLSLGFVLKKLYEEKKNLLNSVFLSAVLYFILRIPVLFTEPSLTGQALLYTMLTSFLLSFSLGIVFLIRKSLWLPIFLHFFYLISLDLVLF